MPVFVEPHQRLSGPIAGCRELARMTTAAKENYSRLTQTPRLEIEAHAREVNAVLALSGSERARAAERAERALGLSGGAMIRQARKAVLACADLFLVLAVQSHDPCLIAAATGVDLCEGGANFMLQMLTAQEGRDQQQIAITLLDGRWMTIHALIGGPGERFAQQRQTLIRAVSGTMLCLSGPLVDEDALRPWLRTMYEALVLLEAETSGLPQSNAEWQQWMLNQLDAEIFVLEVLQSDYTNTDCRTDAVPGFVDQPAELMPRFPFGTGLGAA